MLDIPYKNLAIIYTAEITRMAGYYDLKRKEKGISEKIQFWNIKFVDKTSYLGLFHEDSLCHIFGFLAPQSIVTFLTNQE